MVPAVAWQPAGYARINRGHPLARGLLEFYLLGSGGAIWDALGGRVVAGTFTGATRSVDRHGAQIDIANSASNKLQLASSAPRTADYTVLTLARMTADAWASFAGVFALTDASNTAILTIQETSGNVYVYVSNSTGVNSGVAVGTYFPSGAWVLAGVSGSTPAGTEFWKDGKRIASSASHTAPNNVTADHINIGNERTAGVSRPGSYVLFARWDRVLTAGEHELLGANPWRMFEQPIAEMLVPPGTGQPGPGAQIARPNATLDFGQWRAVGGVVPPPPPGTGGVEPNPDLAGVIDEPTASDGDYATTPAVGSSFEVALSPLDVPAARTGHTVRFRARAPFLGVCEVLLKEGRAIRAAWYQAMNSAFATYERTLTTEQAQAISNYANLRVQIRALGLSLGGVPGDYEEPPPPPPPPPPSSTALRVGTLAENVTNWWTIDRRAAGEDYDPVGSPFGWSTWTLGPDYLDADDVLNGSNHSITTTVVAGAATANISSLPGGLLVRGAQISTAQIDGSSAGHYWVHPSSVSSVDPSLSPGNWESKYIIPNRGNGASLALTFPTSQNGATILIDRIAGPQVPDSYPYTGPSNTPDIWEVDCTSFAAISARSQSLSEGTYANNPSFATDAFGINYIRVESRAASENIVAWFMLGGSARTDVYIRYLLWIEDDVNATNFNELGMKLPGQTNETGGSPALINNASELVSLRLWHGRPTSANPGIVGARTYGYDLTGNPREDPLNFYFKTGRWYNIEQRVRLNDIGQANGVETVWVNGHLMYDAARQYRANANTLIGNLHFNIYHGGSGSYPLNPMHYRIARIAMSTSRIGVVPQLLTANQAPSVSAGTDQTITLPNAVTLAGTASDDGLPSPPGALTLAWSKVSGPGTVTFANAASASTTATFSVDGSYVLRLTANDGDLSAQDDVSVTVNPQSPPIYPAWRLNKTQDTVYTLANTRISDLVAATLTAEAALPQAQKHHLGFQQNLAVDGWIGYAKLGTTWYNPVPGGHGASTTAAWENAVYKIDLSANAPGWVYDDIGSVFGAVTTTRRYSDGRLCARHTYRAPQGIPGTNKILMVGCSAPYALYFPGTPYSGGHDVDEYDVSTHAWAAANLHPSNDMSASTLISPAVVLDPNTLMIYYGHSTVWRKYDYTNRTWSTHTWLDEGGSTLFPFGEWACSFFDDSRGTVVIIGGTNLTRFNVSDRRRSANATVTGLPSGGINTSYYPQAVHDEDNDRYVVVLNDGAVYAINPTTFAATQIATVTPPANGVHNRLQYWPEYQAITYHAHYGASVEFIPTVTT